MTKQIVGTRIGNLSDLPDALRNQLSMGRSSVSSQIENVLVKSLDGCGTVDEIMVALFRAHDVVLLRDKLVSRIHRMIRAGRLQRIGQNNPAVYKVVQS